MLELEKQVWLTLVTNVDHQKIQPLCQEPDHNKNPKTCKFKSQVYGDRITGGRSCNKLYQVRNPFFGYPKSGWKEQEYVVVKGIKTKDGPSEKIVTQTFDHPNILHALFNHTFVVEEDKTGMSDMIYMVFPYYGQGDLMDYRTKYPTLLTESDLREVGKQLLSGVGYAHQRGWVHRDLKPENILVYYKDPRRPQFVIGDWGFTSFAPQGHRFKKYCGSLQSCSPELLQGKPYCGYKSDVWGLLCTFYFACFGVHPFSSRINYVEYYSKIMEIKSQLHDIQGCTDLDKKEQETKLTQEILNLRNDIMFKQTCEEDAEEKIKERIYAADFYNDFDQFSKASLQLKDLFRSGFVLNPDDRSTVFQLGQNEFFQRQ